MGIRQIRAMAKSTLWRFAPLAWVLNGMGQLRITRGKVDRNELAHIVAVLRAGGCVGIFPEGGISQGEKRRAYSGAGWLANAVLETRVVAVTITGAVDLAHFPRRPHIVVEFFEPLGGQLHPGESSIGLSRRVTAEIRARAPAVASGRHR
jgi:1-acyl-sn-glycerol-3-phosphate acyltransferase